MKHLIDQKCPMRDGVLLNFDLYQPDDDAAHPVVLMRTPYTKEAVQNEGIYTNFSRYTDHGISVMIMECRGTGLSEGLFKVNAESEYQDGYDSVEWIASQPWCDGHVGMFGLSYFGFTQLAAASRAPKGLDAICPFMTQAMAPFGSQITQTYNYGHICWIYGQLLGHMERFLPDEKVRAEKEPILRAHAEKLNQYAMHLPADQNPAALVEGVPLLKDYLDLIRGVEDRAFWASIEHPTDFSRAHTAMFHCTGWFDVCLDTTIHNWTAVQQQADAYTRENARLLIGPWSHGGRFHAVHGRFNYGSANDGCGQDVNGRMLDWFKRYLAGDETAAKDWPVVRYYVLNADKWLEDSAWPPAAAKETPYYLHSEGRLSTAMPDAETPDTFTYDPADPCPGYAPQQEGRQEQIPDYAPVSARDDVLTYETPVLEQDLTIAGIMKMRLFAATTAKDTDFACRVLDVYPDGFEYSLNAGLVRGKWRKGFFVYDPVTPGKAEAYEIEIGSIAACLKAGHKLKIQVSSSLFPLYDRNLNTGEPAAGCDHCETAVQTVLHDRDHPSCVLLPVITL